MHVVVISTDLSKLKDFSK